MDSAKKIQQLMDALQLDVPTIEKYKTVAKEVGELEEIETLSGGGVVGWYGPKLAPKVLGYIPGGGFVSYASVYQIQAAYDIFKHSKSHHGDGVALAVLSYDIVSVQPFPAQLHQTVNFINHILKGRSAENIDLFGESAGGALIMGSILHISHPHPKSERLTLLKGEQFGRVLLISPSGPVPTSAASFTENKRIDSFTPEMVHHLWATIGMKENHDVDIPLESPWLAPALKLEEHWYADWPVTSTHIIWGEDEILRDDIARIANIIKKKNGESITVESIAGAGHCPFILERLLKAPPGPYATAMSRWGQQIES